MTQLSFSRLQILKLLGKISQFINTPVKNHQIFIETKKIIKLTTSLELKNIWSLHGKRLAENLKRFYSGDFKGLDANSK